MEKYIKIIEHYESCLEKYGDTHKGVDWPVAADVETRYQVMLDVVKYKEISSNTISLLDFGCGTGHLLEFLQTNDNYTNIVYSGLDISEKFINVCKSKFKGIDFFCTDILNGSINIGQYDYVIMNGVFTEKRELSFDEMWEYFKKMIERVFALTKIGIAFNVMSKAVDWERDDLFHLSTDLLINFLTKNVSRNFIIRNDYGLYEYSVYLYK